MGYLRGTKKTMSATMAAGRPFRKPTLRNQVNALQRQVNRQKPEVQHLIQNNSITSTSPGNQLYTSSPVENLVGNADFRQKITGDQWMLNYLQLKVNSGSALKYLRIIVYIAKRPGHKWTNGSYPTTEFLDPSEFTVIRDISMPNTNFNSTSMGNNFFIPLNKLVVYDSDSATIEKGNLRIAFIFDEVAEGFPGLDFGWKLGFSNK